jgi:hypothetical protein
MTLQTSGQISFNDIANEYGGSTPISMSNYYSGGSNVPSYTEDVNHNIMPASGAIPINEFYGTKKWVPSYQTLGDAGTALVYGSHTVSGGSTGMPGWTWIYNNEIGNLYQVYCSSTYFPMLPSLQNNFGEGTGNSDTSPYYTQSNCPIFVWRTPYSYWTNAMVAIELGLNSFYQSQIKTANRVWYQQTYCGMDNVVQYGIAVIDSRNFNAGAPGSAWNNRSITQYFENYDFGGEWQGHGFIFSPSVSINGTNVTITNTGPGSFTMTGATSRDGGGVIGSLSDYTVSLNDYQLAFLVVYSDLGCAGGANNGARNSMCIQTGHIALS